MSTILDDITSGDAHRIWSSSCAIAKLRDTDELDLLSANLPKIEDKTRGIDLGGALFPNNQHLEFALRKLHHYQSKMGCLCGLYPDYLMFNPREEEKAGNIRILGSTQGQEWNAFYDCQCVLCNTLFRVEEGEYHYTWWNWSVVQSNPESNETTVGNNS